MERERERGGENMSINSFMRYPKGMYTITQDGIQLSNKQNWKLAGIVYQLITLMHKLDF